MSKVAEIKGRWIVGSLAVLLMLPVVFIVGLVVGINIEDAITLSQDTLKPSVNLYLKSNPAAFNFIDVHVVNNGLGTAQNVRFAFKNASPDTQEVYEYLIMMLNKLVIFEKGISSLSSGEHRTSYLFSFIKMHKKFGEKALESITEVDIDFKDTEGTKYTSKSYFNFMEYKGISELGGGDPLYKISSQLEKIQKDIGHFASGFKKLKTDVYTSDDREKEREEWERHRAELQSKQNESS